MYILSTTLVVFRKRNLSLEQNIFSPAFPSLKCPCGTFLGQAYFFAEFILCSPRTSILWSEGSAFHFALFFSVCPKYLIVCILFRGLIESASNILEQVAEEKY